MVRVSVTSWNSRSEGVMEVKLHVVHDGVLGVV